MVRVQQPPSLVPLMERLTREERFCNAVGIEPIISGLRLTTTERKIGQKREQKDKEMVERTVLEFSQRGERGGNGAAKLVVHHGERGKVGKRRQRRHGTRKIIVTKLTVNRAQVRSEYSARTVRSVQLHVNKALEPVKNSRGNGAIDLILLKIP